MGRCVRGILAAFKAVLGVFLGLLLVALALVGYGINGQEYRTYVAFSDAVDRWQAGPEFRSVGMEYCRLSSNCVRTRPFGVSGPTLLMTLRSLPYLPPNLAASSTSREHYAQFARGPLSAYLRLAAEQGMEWAGSFIELAGQPNLSDDDAKAFLKQFNFPVPLDGGAVASLRRLLKDIGSEALDFHGRVDAKSLAPYVARLAGKLNYIDTSLMTSVEQEEVPAQLTFEQQEAVFERLDAEVYAGNREFWRAKQITDFLAGIWAQGYGPTYNTLVRKTLRLRAVGRWGTPVVLVGMLGGAGLRLRRRHQAKLTAEGDNGQGETPPAP